MLDLVAALALAVMMGDAVDMITRVAAVRLSI
jgi:hypothetical protein